MGKGLVKIKWGIGGLTISTRQGYLSLDYVDLIRSFLKVDLLTRQQIGKLLVTTLKRKKS